MKATRMLHEIGQSPWLDNITRDLLDSGTLKRYIDELAVTGLTSNPTIFDHAIKSSTAYDAAIRQKVKEGKTGEPLFFELALEDLSRAADLFRPIWNRTDGVDGWVSLEVSPHLAHDTTRTLAAARDLHARAGRPNLLIKIPGTTEGLPAIEEAIFSGKPINVTLLFSREQYLAAAEAFMRGVERRIAAGLNPNVGSVASVFVSRWDGAVANKVPTSLRNQLGIAIAKRTYKAARDLLSSPCWRRATTLGPARSVPVGQHRHEGSSGVRRAVRQSTGCPVHREHPCRKRLSKRSPTTVSSAEFFRPTAATAKKCWRSSPRPGSTSTLWRLASKSADLRKAS
jgi:transaldolase